VDVIKKVTPENRSAYEDQLYRFNFKEDCPVMERLYDYVLSYTTGSVGILFVYLACASLLCEGKFQYGINWSGGLHHAKQS
jgi:histone deacetylase 1/2